MTPGEQTRDYYRQQGREQERAVWLEAVAALRESMNELMAGSDDRVTNEIARLVTNQLTILNTVADSVRAQHANTNL